MPRWESVNCDMRCCTVEQGEHVLTAKGTAMETYVHYKKSVFEGPRIQRLDRKCIYNDRDWIDRGN